MNAIDGTDRHVKTDEAPPPSLLAIVLDTNPHAWAHLSSTISLTAALANLLVFINAHLSSGNENEVAVIASHVNRAEWLFPTPKRRTPARNGSDAMDVDDTIPVNENPNKYRPFAMVENAIRSNLARLLATTTESQLQNTPSTLIGGALSLALAHIAKSTLLHSPVDALTAADSTVSALTSLVGADDSRTQRLTLTSRILIVSVSGDLANQYVPIMNSIFAAQRKRIPIDILKLAGDTVLLQQASDATGGVYIKPERPEGLLQYLMMGFLPDGPARSRLVMPSAGGVDFRAACFCHRKVVDIGYVCSVCLSIFCEPSLPDNLCLTCGSYLSLRTAQMAQPALIPRKKKKKKKLPGDSATPSGANTPIHA